MHIEIFYDNRGSGLAQSIEQETFDLGAVRSSPLLGIDIT